MRTTPFRYHVFKEIREPLFALLAERWVPANVVPEDDCINRGEEKEPYDLYRNFIVFILMLAKEPLRKTKTGSLNKKQLDHWHPLFPQQPESIFELFVCIATALGLAEDTGMELCITQNCTGCLELDESAQAALFYSCILDLAAKHKCLYILELMNRAYGRYLPVDKLCDFFVMPNVDENVAFVDSGCINIMLAANFIRCGKSRDDKRICTITELGRAALAGDKYKVETVNGITVMPTFEILVPKQLSVSALRILFMCCEPVKSDAFLTFMIGREALYEGFEKGVEPDSFIQFIGKASDGRIPQNVKFSLEEWIQSWGTVSFEMHFLLKIKSPEMYNKIKGAIGSSAYIKEEFPSLAISINPSDYKVLFDILVKLGYNPKPFTAVKNIVAGGSKKTQGDLRGFSKNFGKPDQIIFENDSSDFIFPEKTARDKGGISISGRKYAGKMVELPFNELVHVINYAMLMEQGIEIENDHGELLFFHPRELSLHSSQPKVSGVNQLSGAGFNIELAKIKRIRTRD
jgi:hypothetical protein